MSENYIRTMGAEEILAAQKQFLSKVYGWMLFGLLTTACTALFMLEGNYIEYFLYNSTYMWVLIIAQFGLVIGLGSMINKMSSFMAGALFVVYSALTGITFSTIFIVYTATSIYNTFFITAGAFGALSLYGFTTKKDLTAMGSFMFMGLFGLIIASVLNIFIGSSALEFVISVIGVIVFAGLTAYDTKKLKEMYVLQAEGEEVASRAAILGALKLYLDFINLFLFLLRFLGNRE